MSNENQEPDERDWKKVVIDIILKIITLGLYHLERHRTNKLTNIH